MFAVLAIKSAYAAETDYTSFYNSGAQDTKIYSAASFSNGNILLGALLNDGEGAWRDLLYVNAGDNTCAPANISLGGVPMGLASRQNGRVIILINTSSSKFKAIEVDSNQNITWNSGELSYSTVGVSAVEIVSAVTRPNGDVIFADSEGRAAGYTSGNTLFKISSGNDWYHSTDLTVLIPLSDNRVLAAGESGNWQIINSNNTWNSSSKGTLPDSFCITCGVQRPDGTIVLFDSYGKYAIYNSSMTLVTSGTLALHPTSAVVLNNGYVLIGSGFAGKHQILKPDNTLTSDFIITHHSDNVYDEIIVRNNDGSVFLFGGQSYTFQTRGGYRRCYFQVGAPGKLSATQTSIDLSWTMSTPGPWEYVLEYRKEGLSTWTTGYTGTNTTCQITGLEAGTRYYFRVRARLDSTLVFNYSNESSYRTIPSTPSAPTGTTSRLAWSSTAGRSNVVLSWPAVAGANGYKVWVFDGNAYRAFDVGNTTSWNLSGARIYPDENWLNSQADNSILSDPFNHSGGGFALRDDPNKLYKKTVGTSCDNAHNYWFRVSAYNEAGESSYSANAYTPTLPDATDTGAPSGTNSTVSSEGLEKTYNTLVRVTVTAAESESGIYQILLSNDNVTYTVKYTATKGADGGTGITSYSGTFDWMVAPGAGTKIVYVKIVDAVGNSVVVSDSIALVEDMLPPSITLQINRGAASTTSNNVTLTILVFDNTSTSSQMQMAFSNDGNLWSLWEAYNQTKSWDITNSSYGGTTGAGVKKVYVRIYDQAQNIGLASAEIAYNPAPPTASNITFTGGVSGTFNGQPVVFVKGDMPVLNVTAAGSSLMRYDNGIGIWSDWETYVPNKQIIAAKSSGVCKIRVQVADTNRVASDPVGTLVVIDNTPPTIQKVSGQNGATAATSSTFNIVVQASDDLPSQLQACASVDGGAYGDWHDVPQNTVPVTLSTTGAHTVRVKVRDLAGNESQAYMTVFRIAA